MTNAGPNMKDSWYVRVLTKKIAFVYMGWCLFIYGEYLKAYNTRKYPGFREI